MSRRSNRGFQTPSKSEFDREMAETVKHLKQGRLNEAAIGCRRLLQIVPTRDVARRELAVVLEELGSALRSHGRPDLAVSCYREAIGLHPQLLAAQMNLGLAYGMLNQPDLSIAQYRQALAIDPNCIAALCNLGLACRGEGRLDEAEEWFRRALAVAPNAPDGIACLADLLELRGDLEGAHALLTPLVDRPTSPINSVLVFATVCHRRREPEVGLPYLKQGLTRPDLTSSERAQLYFRQGELLDALDRFDDAFDSYRRANLHSVVPFDPLYWRQETDRIIATLDARTLAALPRSGLNSQLPVFVVGMPRSGTSLVEQILASYPQVRALGERPDLDVLSASLPASLPAEWLKGAAQTYLERLTSLSPGALRATDKQPTNYRHLWLVSLAFPGARVIHCQRDPLDTCLSCYFQNFNTRQPYAGDLSHLGLVYRQYDRLMNHWRSVLDLPVLDVSYEELVADTETISRRMVTFLGLDWDSRCLEFHRTKRVVNTASYDQVRRPIYNRSVGRARQHYGQYLEPLIAALNS